MATCGPYGLMHDIQDGINLLMDGTFKTLVESVVCLGLLCSKERYLAVKFHLNGALCICGGIGAVETNIAHRFVVRNRYRRVGRHIFEFKTGVDHGRALQQITRPIGRHCHQVSVSNDIHACQRYLYESFSCFRCSHKTARIRSLHSSQRKRSNKLATTTIWTREKHVYG